MIPVIFTFHLLVGIFFFLAGRASLKEGEPLAARRLTALAGSWLAAAVLSFLFLPTILIIGSAALLLAVLIFLVPTPTPPYRFDFPKDKQYDERDILFSRNKLIPGTDRYQEYYRTHPEEGKKDALFRQEPGLLQPGSRFYHQVGFAAANASFETVETLHALVEGEAAPEKTPFSPQYATRFVKNWVLKMGAHSVGICHLKPEHLYTHIGRGKDYGQPVALQHRFAIAFTVEMDKELLDGAPQAPAIMESARQYLNAGVIAVQLAETIRQLGYPARAHIDANYRVMCTLVARDAGLGEIGRMGLLMTPRLGPRVRIAVVTTDLPLLTDAPQPAPDMLDFCQNCQKCAEACPSRAIQTENLKPDGPLDYWQIDKDPCFLLWSQAGTDCGRCMEVCPYSHPDTWLHRPVRWALKRSALFRKTAARLDDWLYGRVPPANQIPDWVGKKEDFNS